LQAVDPESASLLGATASELLADPGSSKKAARNISIFSAVLKVPPQHKLVRLACAQHGQMLYQIWPCFC
jgi:hypothetical protein